MPITKSKFKKHVFRLFVGACAMGTLAALIKLYWWCWENLDWFLIAHCVVAGLLLCYATGSFWDYIRKRRK
jgi:hypothetical protein